MLTFDVLIRALLSAFMSICLVAKPSSLYYTDLAEKNWPFLGFIILTTVAFTVFILATKHDKLIEKNFRKRWGSFYQGVDKRKGKMVFLISSFFFLRRILLASLVHDDFASFQILYTPFTSMVWLAYLLHFKPFETRYQLTLEVVNELSFLMVTYFISLYSEIIPTYNRRS